MRSTTIKSAAKGAAEVNRAVDSLIRKLLAIENQDQQALCQHHVRAAQPNFRAKLIERLVVHLKHAKEKTRQRAAAWLMALGSASVPALRYAAWHGRSVPARVRCLETLAAIGQHLDDAVRVELMFDLLILTPLFGNEPEIVVAAAKALNQIRDAQEQATRVPDSRFSIDPGKKQLKGSAPAVLAALPGNPQRAGGEDGDVAQ